jgi:hypothetical protein
MIDVNGSVVTVDAMGTQSAIADKIINNGADYILAVKTINKLCVKMWNFNSRSAQPLYTFLLSHHFLFADALLTAILSLSRGKGEDYGTTASRKP